MNILCENGIDKSDGNITILICLKTNEPCGFIRYCQTDNCIKMVNNYTSCNYRDKVGAIMAKENKNELKEEIINTENDNKTTKQQKCEVLIKNNKKLLVNFNNYGITIPNDLIKDINKISNTILVNYEGEIGKSDFNVISIKD